MDSNSIVENINYYIEEAPSLGLSFVIDGPWGSGKTHFIKNALKGKKYIYLSLFGCASISQVRREMFYSLRPILRNRIFRDFLGATKSAIKAKTGFDMNSDSREDISLSLDVGALNFWDYFGSERKIIVLDDLERYSGDFAGLFGFVNKLSGEAGCKVVIVSNGSKFDDEGKSVFNEYFDKIVWMQVLFEAPIRDFLQSIRSNSAFSGVDIDFWSIVFEEIDRVIDFDLNSISNFRIINSLLMIINKYKDIIRSKLIEGDRIRGFVTLFSFLFIYIKHEKINFSELEAYRRSKISGENMNHQIESNFINFLELNKENEVLFLKLIEKNYFSKEIIEREVIENILDYQNEIRGKTISNYDSLQLSIISRDDELLSDSFNGVMRELSAGKDFSIFDLFQLYDVSITLEEFGAVKFSSEMQIAIKEKINKMVGCSYLEDLDTNFNLEPSFYDEDIKFGIFNSNHKSMTLFFDFFHEKIYEHRKLLMDKNSRAFLKGLESQDLKYIKMLGFIISLDSGIGFYIPLNEEKAEHIHLMITKWDTIFFEKFIGSLIKRYNSDSFFINDEVLFLKKFIRNVESYSKDCKYIRRHVLDSGLKQLKSIFLRHEDKNIET